MAMGLYIYLVVEFRITTNENTVRWISLLAFRHKASLIQDPALRGSIEIVTPISGLEVVQLSVGPSHSDTVYTKRDDARKRLEDNLLQSYGHRYDTDILFSASLSNIYTTAFPGVPSANFRDRGKDIREIILQ